MWKFGCNVVNGILTCIYVFSVQPQLPPSIGEAMKKAQKATNPKKRQLSNLEKPFIQVARELIEFKVNSLILNKKVNTPVLTKTFNLPPFSHKLFAVQCKASLKYSGCPHQSHLPGFPLHITATPFCHPVAINRLSTLICQF